MIIWKRMNHINCRTGKKTKLSVKIVLLLCSLTRLFASHPDIQYVFPVPGSSHVPAGTEILVRFKNIQPSQIANLESFIRATGEKSGFVSGDISVMTDQKTVRFMPDEPFQIGETVTVQINPLIQGQSIPDKLHFTIHDRPEIVTESVQKNPCCSSPVFDHSAHGTRVEDPLVLNGVSVPSSFPMLNILVSDNPAPGNLFISYGWGTPVQYHIIYDSTGAPVWYTHSSCWFPMNLDLHETGVIAMNATHEHSFGEGYIAMDHTYTVTDSFWINWNGYVQNSHELLLLQDGRIFMIGEKDYDIDLSQYIPGARTSVNVEETAIFGFPAGSLTPNFIWRAFDHLNIADMDEPEFDELNTLFLRFPHMNALDIDTDGHLLVSCRHMSEIIKINIETDDIIWRLGGKNNQFTFIDDDLQGPSSQHDVRALGDNRYTVFDNGNLHDPPVSRGVEWELDTTAMTATLVWEYRNTEVLPEYSYFMGNNQRLPNGNRLINWAYSHNQFKLVTEVTPGGDKTFEFGFEDNTDIYRVRKYEWDAVAAIPYLVAEVYTDAVTLIFNKFGDTDVDYYNIYGDTRRNPDTIIAISEKPFVHLTRELVNNRRNYFRVTAVNHAGQESGFSNQVDVRVSLFEPEENMMDNGNFENGFTRWEWSINNAEADYEITGDRQLHLMIQDGGSDVSDIQVLYPGLPLIHGKQYCLEFDARGAQSRTIVMKLRDHESPWTDFSKIGATLLLPNMNHYSYAFVMEDPSEPEAQFILSAGGNDHDLYLDNVSLKQGESTEVDPLEPLSISHVLLQNYPNPFNASTKIQFTLQKDAYVTVRIVDVNGRTVRKLVNGMRSSGLNAAIWNGETDAGAQAVTGVYIVHVHAKGRAFEERMSRKVLLVK